MKKTIVFALLALSAGHALAADDNPLLGEWNWKLSKGECRETHLYRADGTAMSKSGDEILEKTYTVSEREPGMYFVEQTIVSTNGGNDCTGSSTPVGATSSVYIMMLKGGGYFTCSSESGLSCYGSASKIASPSVP
jgi:hypothetical protein